MMTPIGEQAVADMVAESAGLTGPGVFADQGKIHSVFSHGPARDFFAL